MERDGSPDWMRTFKNPAQDITMLSSSSPSSSPSRNVRKKDKSLAKFAESEDEYVSPLKQEGGRGGKKSAKLSGKRTSLKGVRPSVIDIDDDEEDDLKVVSTRRLQFAEKRIGTDDEEEEEEDNDVIFSSIKLSGRGKRTLESDDDELYQPLGINKKVVLSPKQKAVQETQKPVLRSKRAARNLVDEEKKPASKRSRSEADVLPMNDNLKQCDGEQLPLLPSPKKKASKALKGNAIASTVTAGSSGVAKRGKIAEESGLVCLAEIDVLTEGDKPVLTGEVLQDDETGEIADRKSKSRVVSNLPLVFPDKVHRSKVLLECEGDALDLSGDMGAVGRFIVLPDQDKDEDELLLDLKGIIYKATILKSNTFFVVNVGPSEAKVEAMMNDFLQLQGKADGAGNETVVEGTLEGFEFDMETDVDGMGPPTTNIQVDSDGNEEKLKKTPTKVQKSKKSAAQTSKGGRGSAKGGNTKKGKVVAKKASKSKPPVKRKQK